MWSLGEMASDVPFGTEECSLGSKTTFSGQAGSTALAKNTPSGRHMSTPRTTELTCFCPNRCAWFLRVDEHDTMRMLVQQSNGGLYSDTDAPWGNSPFLNLRSDPPHYLWLKHWTNYTTVDPKQFAFSKSEHSATRACNVQSWETKDCKAPLHSTPLPSPPLHTTPHHSTPLHPTPLHSTWETNVKDCKAEADTAVQSWETNVDTGRQM